MNKTANDLPSTCRAALFRAANQPLELVDVPLPEVQTGEALVRIDYCTMCGSDWHTINGARIEPMPSVLGHEVLGTVSVVGDSPLTDVEGVALQSGDRITWSPAASCNTCDRCAAGLPQKCRTLFKYGHAVANGRDTLSGGLAEYILLRQGTAAVKLNQDDPAEVFGPASCATATVAAAARAAGKLHGQNILIFGAGMLGLTATALAKSHGAKHITVCDPNATRLQLAERFGADRVVQWNDDDMHIEGDVPANVVFELSGAARAVEAAFRCGEIGAKIVLVGSVMDSPPAQIDPTALVRKCLSVHGVHNYAPQDLLTAVRFLQQHHAQFPFAEMVERTFPLAEINAATEFARQQRPIRIAILPN